VRGGAILPPYASRPFGKEGDHVGRHRKKESPPFPEMFAEKKGGNLLLLIVGEGGELFLSQSCHLNLRDQPHLILRPFDITKREGGRGQTDRLPGNRHSRVCSWSVPGEGSVIHQARKRGGISSPNRKWPSSREGIRFSGRKRASLLKQERTRRCLRNRSGQEGRNGTSTKDLPSDRSSSPKVWRGRKEKSRSQASPRGVVREKEAAAIGEINLLSTFSEILI